MLDEPFSLKPDSPVDDLREQAKTIFVPSKPITSQEFLFGREAELQQTLDSLEVPGRSVFIYGERGVGKTSLASTAAHLHNSSQFEPIVLACTPEATLSRLVIQVVQRVLNQPFLRPKTKVTTEAKFKNSWLEILRRIEQEPMSLPERIDLNDAVDLLKEVAPKDPKTPLVVVLDEVDTIESHVARKELAFFIKQLGDRECPIKFIFVGIADSVDELLSNHESASRYIATVPLKKLDYFVLIDIVSKGFGRLGIPIWDGYAARVAWISDGFAHYTHLLSLKLALRALSTEQVQPVSAAMLTEALDDAVRDSEAWLKQAYDKAVKKYRDMYEPILWAVADHWQTDRLTDEIYPAYVKICETLKRDPLERKKLSLALNALKTDAHGQALVSTRRSWFRFRKSMLRGYCRMVALSRNVEIGLDYLEQLKQGAASTRTSARSSVGERQDSD